VPWKTVAQELQISKLDGWRQLPGGAAIIRYKPNDCYTEGSFNFST